MSNPKPLRSLSEGHLPCGEKQSQQSCAENSLTPPFYKTGENRAMTRQPALLCVSSISGVWQKSCLTIR